MPEQPDIASEVAAFDLMAGGGGAPQEARQAPNSATMLYATISTRAIG